MATINELYELIQRHPVCSVATIDGDQPRLRIFWTWFVDDTGLYFHTPKKGNAYQQMLQNNNVELCYFEEGNNNLMIRASGKVHFINNRELIVKLLHDRPFLQELSAEDAPENVYGIFMLKKDEILLR